MERLIKVKSSSLQKFGDSRDRNIITPDLCNNGIHGSNIGNMADQFSLFTFRFSGVTNVTTDYLLLRVKEPGGVKQFIKRRKLTIVICLVTQVFLWTWLDIFRVSKPRALVSLFRPRFRPIFTSLNKSMSFFYPRPEETFKNQKGEKSDGAFWHQDGKNKRRLPEGGLSPFVFSRHVVPNRLLNNRRKLDPFVFRFDDFGI